MVRKHNNRHKYIILISKAYINLLPTASKPVLGPEASAETYLIDSTIQSTNTSAYLNINDADTSYKLLSLGETSNTTAWGLEGDTIVTTEGSVYGRRELRFVLSSELK